MIWVLALAACGDEALDSGPPGPDPCLEPGTICTWLGQPGVAIFAPDGHRLETGLYLPQDLAFGPDGSAWVVDLNNNRIRYVDPDGQVRTVTGVGMPGDGHDTEDCWVGCPAPSTHWWHPGDVVVDPLDADVVYVAAWHNHRVSRVDRVADEVRWLVGTGRGGYGPDQLSLPSSVVIDDDGALYVSDEGNSLIRRLDPDGALVDIAGSRQQPGYAGDGGPALGAALHGNSGWSAGPTSKLALRGRELYVADTLNGVIRRVDLDTGHIERVAGVYRSMGTYSTVVGPGVLQVIDAGSEPGYGGDGGPAREATFSRPRDIALGPDGSLYVADTGNHCVRRIDPEGFVDTVVGRCGESGFEGDGGPATDALLWQPTGVAVDPEGALYVTDSYNHVVRRLTP